MYVVKIVLLIEHWQNWLPVCVRVYARLCVCVCVCSCALCMPVFFSLFFLVLLGIKVVQSEVKGSNPGHNEMIDKLK